jgi:ubiquinone/menaquinone biosynthesis C-methylase UbiE
MEKHEAWHLSAEAAQRYDRYVARYILAPWAPLLVHAARVTVGERVLDVACGTGLVACAAAKRVGPTGQVICLDLNPGMIAVARSLAIGTGPCTDRMARGERVGTGEQHLCL